MDEESMLQRFRVVLENSDPNDELYSRMKGFMVREHYEAIDKLSRIAKDAKVIKIKEDDYKGISFEELWGFYSSVIASRQQTFLDSLPKESILLANNNLGIFEKTPNGIVARLYEERENSSFIEEYHVFNIESPMSFDIGGMFTGMKGERNRMVWSKRYVNGMFDTNLFKPVLDYANITRNLLKGYVRTVANLTNPKVFQMYCDYKEKTHL